MPTLATRSECTGCLACENRCPHNAIAIVEGDDGHKYIEIVPDKCIECKLCEKTCPIVNGRVYGKNELLSQFYGGWAKDETIRNSGATSGIFGQLAYKIILEDGWVAGAVMNGLKCEYIITNSLAELGRLQGSKYTYSNPKGIYGRVVEKLREGKTVLFCGLPCHVGALISYLPPTLLKNLYTIDLICGGVSSPILINRFKDEYPKIRNILSFRDKLDGGWKPEGYRYRLIYQDQYGENIQQKKSSRNLITDGFACELTDRYSCYSCCFSYASRKSDITIGDLWGDKMLKKQHKKGVSVIIVHSEKGGNLLNNANIEKMMLPSEKILTHNRRIFYGKSIKRFFPERRMMGWLFRHLSYNALLKVYCSDLRNKSFLSLLIIPYRVVSFGLYKVITRYSSNRLLKKMES